jgi:signal transduction histidine kinase
LAQQLFDTFFTTKASGMGLGLTISRAIAMAHGGDLTVEAGDRALFKLSLPREDASHDNERLPDFPG